VGVAAHAATTSSLLPPPPLPPPLPGSCRPRDRGTQSAPQAYTLPSSVTATLCLAPACTLMTVKSPSASTSTGTSFRQPSGSRSGNPWGSTPGGGMCPALPPPPPSPAPPPSSQSLGSLSEPSEEGRPKPSCPCLPHPHAYTSPRPDKNTECQAPAPTLGLSLSNVPLSPPTGVPVLAAHAKRGPGPRGRALNRPRGTSESKASTRRGAASLLLPP
jgi:hypothetical protein